MTESNTDGKLFDVGLILGLMVIAVVVAFLFFFKQSLRLDESQSLWQTSRNLPAMFNLVSHDVHVPLYHILLHFWEKFFGNQVQTTRLMSLVFFVATIPAVYALGALAYNRKVGRLAAVLVTISPFLNWYGSETRMYSLLVFITVLSQYFFVGLWKGKYRFSRWGYAISAFFGMFTHYFFFLVLAAQAVFLILYRKNIDGKVHKFFWKTMGVLALLFSPWVYLVAHSGFAKNSTPDIAPPNSFNLIDTFSQFVFGFQDDHLDSVLVSLWPISIVLSLWAMHKNAREQLESRLPNLYLLLAGVLPVVLVFVISLKFPFYLSRYLIFTIPALYLLLSWVVSLYTPFVSRAFSAVLVVVMGISLANQALSAGTPVKENYQAAAVYLEQHADVRDAIILSAPFTIYPMSYYYTGPLALNTLPVWDRYANGAIPAFSEQNLPQEVAALTNGHQDAWVLLSYDQGYNENIRLYFDTHFQRIDHQTFSPGLDIYEYKIKY